MKCDGRGYLVEYSKRTTTEVQCEETGFFDKEHSEIEIYDHVIAGKRKTIPGYPKGIIQ